VRTKWMRDAVALVSRVYCPANYLSHPSHRRRVGVVVFDTRSITHAHAGFASNKEELLKYCKVRGYPRPLALWRTFPGVALRRCDIKGGSGWDRSASSCRLGVYQREDKMAWEVLRHLRSRDMGEGGVEDK